MQHYRYATVLTIAGSDSSGGAGIQADLKTFSALGCYGASAITAVTAQNTCGVLDIYPLPTDFVVKQIKAVMDDLCPLAIKIGMIHSPEMAMAVSSVLEQYPNVPVVMDPVMVASSGHQLIREETVEIFKNKLFPQTALITPNMDEAAVLLGKPVKSLDEMVEAAAGLLALGPHAVLVKGGHLTQPTLYNVFQQIGGAVEQFAHPAIDTFNTHGTGCTLSSAIAAFIARGNNLRDAVAYAGEYVNSAIEHGSNVKIGHGHGAVNHFFRPESLKKYELE